MLTLMKMITIVITAMTMIDDNDDDNNEVDNDENKGIVYRVRDCFPVPPTPTRRAFPRCCRIMRAMRDTCSIASMKKTSFISFDDCKLYSSRYYKC